MYNTYRVSDRENLINTPLSSLRRALFMPIIVSAIRAAWAAMVEGV